MLLGRDKSVYSRVHWVAWRDPDGGYTIEASWQVITAESRKRNGDYYLRVVSEKREQYAISKHEVNALTFDMSVLHAIDMVSYHVKQRRT